MFHSNSHTYLLIPTNMILWVLSRLWSWARRLTLWKVQLLKDLSHLTITVFDQIRIIQINRRMRFECLCERIWIVSWRLSSLSCFKVNPVNEIRFPNIFWYQSFCITGTLSFQCAYSTFFQTFWSTIFRLKVHWIKNELNTSNLNTCWTIICGT